MPNFWRILLSLDALAKRFDFDYSVTDLVYTYYLRRHDTEMDRFQLVQNPYKAALILGLTSSDRNWKTRFILISANPFTCDGAKPRFPLFWKYAYEYTSFSFLVP